MSYEVERATPCRVVLTATIASDDVRAERDRVVTSFVRAARLDGFRKGKAPKALVERRFADQIREDLEEHLIRRAWEEARQGERLRPASPLGIKESTWLESGEFRLRGEFEVYPSVELPELGGFVPPPFELEPSGEEIAEAVEQLRERQAAWEPVDGEAAEPGMLLEAEVHGTFPDGGGEPFHEERSLFELGREEVYPEIEGAVRGRRVGDEVEVERVVGEEGGEEKAGKRVAYRVRLKGMRRKVLPEVNDAFATSVGVEGGVDALRVRVRDRLRAAHAGRRREAWRAALVDYLSAGKVLDLPEEPVREEVRRELVDFAQALAHRGVDPERAKVDWGKLEGEVRPKVETRLRGEVVLDALAEALAIEVSEGEVDHEVEHQAERIGVPFAELRGNLAKSGGLARVAGVLRRERAVDEALRRFVDESEAS